MFKLKKKKSTTPEDKSKLYKTFYVKNSNRAFKKGLWGDKLVGGIPKWIDCFSRIMVKHPEGEPAKALNVINPRTSKYVRHIGKKQKAKALALVN